jgi:hypothetical protein
MPFWLRLTLFLLAMLLLMGLTGLYVFRRGARLLGLGKRGRLALGGALLAAPLALLAARLFEPVLPPAVAFGLGASGATVVLGVLISTVLLAAVDLPFGLAGLLRRVVGQPAGAAPPAPDREGDRDGSRGANPAAARSLPGGDLPGGGGGGPAAQEDAAADRAAHETEGALPGPRALGRREMVRRTATGAALSVGFGSAFYGSLFGRHDYEINEVPVPIPGLSPHLEGYRIAQLSDVHFGVYVGDPELRSAVELVRRARPDLVVLTGDLVDHDAAFAPWLGRMIRGFEALGVRDGVTVIPGNHDYYAGIDEVLGVSRRAGARVLRNEGRVVGDDGGAFALVGVDDVWARRNGHSKGPDLERALASVPADLPRVLLCHNPVFFPEARGRVALQLSGHTHGGQVNLGLRPAELVLPYVEGLYEEDGSRLYVNRGFGTAGPPARVGAPPEVTVVVLTAA